MITAEHINFLRSLCKKSPCKRRGVASIVLNGFFEVVGYSWNGPAGFDPDNCTGIKDGCGCEHSEVNALLRTPRPRGAYGYSLICTRAPCERCATAIVNCGFIKSFYFLDTSDNSGVSILKSYGVSVTHLEEYEITDPLRLTAQ